MSELKEYLIQFVVDATDEDDAFDKFQDMMMGTTEYIPPNVTPVRNESYEAYTGIKPEGTE